MLGSSGLTGSKITQLARQRFDTYGTYYKRMPSDQAVSFKLDATKEDDLKKLLRQIKPDTIINTIALHNVDYCEQHPEEAFAVNTKVVETIAAVCNNLGARLIHISTDFVFDGTKNGAYSEFDEPHPQSTYGKSKLEGEKQAMLSASYSILRPSVVYGWTKLETQGGISSSGKSINFAMWIIGELSKRKTVKIVNDQFSTPTLADILAAVALRVAGKDINDLYHISSSHCINRYEFAREISLAMGYRDELVAAVSTNDLHQVARRPRNSCLNCKKLEHDLGYKLPNMHQSLSIMRSQMEFEAPSMLNN